MDGVREFLNAVDQHQVVTGHFLGLLQVLIGRKISKADGTVVSNGITWRNLAAELKGLRWDPELVRELGLDPAQFAPRDRQRFWFSVIAQAQVGSPAAAAAGDKFAHKVKALGYVIGPSPRA